MALRCGIASRPRILLNSDFVEGLTVLVGATERRFTIPRNVVCATSKFFHASCERRWKEGLGKLFRLPETEANIFEIYCGWLYTGRIEPSGHIRRQSNDVSPKSTLDYDEAKCDELMIPLITAYAFGDMLQDEAFCNSLMDEIASFQDFEFRCTLVQIHHLRETVPHNSKIAHFFADFWAVCNCPNFLTVGQELPHGFLLRVANASIQSPRGDIVDRLHGDRLWCHYHNHSEIAAKSGEAESSESR